MQNSLFIDPNTLNVGIGTTRPLSKLHVEGNITASNLSILGDFVTLNTITSNTEQMVISNAGTGPALKVTQTGTQPIADFYDDNNVLAMRIANDGLIGIGTTLVKYSTKTQINGGLGLEGTSYVVISPGNGTFGSIEVIDPSNANTKLPLALCAYGGNVGIGTTNPLETLHVNGNIYANGVHKVVTIDLSAQTNTIFYPIVFTDAPAMYTHYFSIEMPSQGHAQPYNMHSLHAVARGAGWSDQRPKYEVFHNYYDANERSILGIYAGTQDFYGIAIYVRGGQIYTILTNSKSVRAYTSAVSLYSGNYPQNPSVFALKNVSGTDVSGTSSSITQLWSGMGEEGKYYSHGLTVNGNLQLPLQCGFFIYNYNGLTYNGLAANGTMYTNGTVNYNDGNYFNTSTGVFTAPLNGKYLIYTSLLVNTGSGRLEYMVVCNGVGINVNGTGTTYDNATTTFVFYLSKNQTIFCSKLSGTAYGQIRTDNFFGVNFLG